MHAVPGVNVPSGGGTESTGVNGMSGGGATTSPCAARFA